MVSVIEEVTYGEAKKALIEDLLSNYEYEGWSQRPNTFVHVKFFRPDGEIIHMRGFSKVSQADKWSQSEGIRVAISKAAARVAKMTLLTEEQCETHYPPVEEGTSISGSVNPS